MTGTAVGTDVSGALIIPNDIPVWVNGAIGWKSSEPIVLTLRLEPAGVRDWQRAKYGLDAITYQISRDLMAEAIAKPEHFVGEGDIQLSYDPDELGVNNVLTYDDADPALRVRVKDSSENWRLFVLDGRSVVSFMTKSYMIVPQAQETADVDTALAQLLDAQ